MSATYVKMKVLLTFSKSATYEKVKETFTLSKSAMSEIWFQRFVITSLFFAYLINHPINKHDTELCFCLAVL